MRERPAETTILNVLPCRIESIRPIGPHDVVVMLDLGSDGNKLHLLARVTRRSSEQIRLVEGMTAYCQIERITRAFA
jgi:ABC-type molybdate transport system ATPase subunit